MITSSLYLASHLKAALSEVGAEYGVAADKSEALAEALADKVIGYRSQAGQPKKPAAKK